MNKYKKFHTIQWRDDKVIILDQRQLPLRETYLKCYRYEEIIRAIEVMAIRGAPAIGIAAAFAVALGINSLSLKSPNDFRQRFKTISRRLMQTRPTAKNLSWALGRMERLLRDNLNAPPKTLKAKLKQEATKILKEDIEVNLKIGIQGRSLVPEGATVLTHCNAGALATGGYGTALGVVRAAIEEGKKVRVLATETRPFLQGARLTTWELSREGIDVTLIPDSAAGFLMSKGEVDLVLVGADRIVANGDVANKIGTYTLSILSNYLKIPFYIAAPTSTFDPLLDDGGAIPIEERGPYEVTHLMDRQISPPGIGVRNPAFDITPHRYISAIITERGILYPPYKKVIKEILNDKNYETTPAPPQSGGQVC